MVLSGQAKMVGFRLGNKNGKVWCSASFDALDDALERVDYFVPEELVSRVKEIKSGIVQVTVRIYPISGQRSFGSRLLDISLVKEGGK